MQTIGRIGNQNCGDLLAQPYRASPNPTRECDARPTFKAVDRKVIQGPWKGPSQASRDGYAAAGKTPAIALANDRVSSLDDLPIALRVSAASRFTGPEANAATGAKTETAMRELELIGGLLSTLARGCT